MVYVHVYDWAYIIIIVKAEVNVRSNYIVFSLISFCYIKNNILLFK